MSNQHISTSNPVPHPAQPMSEDVHSPGIPNDRGNEWLVAKYLDYEQVRENKAERDLLGQKIIDHLSSSATFNQVPQSISVSNPMGIHFGTKSPNESPEVRSMTVMGPPESFLRSFVILPEGNEFSCRVNGEDAAQTKNWPAKKGILLEVASEASTIFGVHSGWLLMLVDVVNETGNSPTLDSYVVYRPLVKVVADKSIAKFEFDVYTKPFVPKQVMDVNMLPCYFVPGLKLTGPEDLSVLREPLPMQPIFDTTNIPIPALSISSYCERFILLLRMDYGSRMQQVAANNMYGTRIISDGTMSRITVPGIVDDNPRLRIGDVIRIRRLPFDGFEYEVVIFRRNQSFNIQFMLNDVLSRAMIRGIQFMGQWMLYGSRMARSFLFPDVEDATFSQRTDFIPSEKLEFRDVNLNISQMRAVQSIVDQKYGQVPFLIVSYLASIFQVIQLNPEFRVLACAPSSSAADTLTRRLKTFLQPGQLLRLISSTRPFMKIMQTRVLVCTCDEADMLVSAGLTNQFSTEHFSAQNLPFFHRTKTVLNFKSDDDQHLFIDEAGQATEPETCLPLSVIANANEYFVPVILSGDHMQLGPLHGFDVSYFERIIGRPLYKDHPDARGAPRRKVEAENYGDTSLILQDIRAPFVNLIRTIAMIVVPSQLSYNNTLVPMRTLRSLTLFCDEGASWWNAIEAAKVLELIESILRHGVSLKDFGIISPFREQVKRLRKLMRARGLGGIDVGTVEDYQGMERKIIILSCVRSRYRFLADDIRDNIGVVNFPRRLNVALTRAKSLLVIVGNPALLVLDPFWKEHLTFYVQNNCYTGCPLPTQLLQVQNDPAVRRSSSTSDLRKPQNLSLTETTILEASQSRSQDAQRRLSRKSSRDSISSRTMPSELVEISSNVQSQPNSKMSREAFSPKPETPLWNHPSSNLTSFFQTAASPSDKTAVSSDELLEGFKENHEKRNSTANLPAFFQTNAGNTNGLDEELGGDLEDE
ncbi:P-loop containing nucleoside triphosphate hydrolase protein [Chytridium lagenaria]|nr:P-loop containing nucleoside triphosphate hydrolase protein [Chytridium lagenaria]